MSLELPRGLLGAHAHEHATGTPHTHGPVLSRRSVIKLGAGTAAAAAAFGLERSSPLRSLRRIDDTQATRPVKTLTLVGTDGWISMPPGAAPAGPIWPDAFANTVVNGVDNTQYNRNLFMFGFAVGGNFESPNPLAWANLWNGVDAPNQPSTSALGGLAALKNRANLSAPILYYHEGDDVRITMWNGGMGNRPDIVDTHTIHWHGFPNQIPYFDGVPNDSLSVPIGSNLVYRYLPYRGMAGSYMYHCHVSDAEHVQMGLQGIVFIRPYQNYGVSASNIPQARATGAASGPLGYCFNDGVAPGPASPTGYAPGSTAYDREFAFILDELDARVHWADAHFAEQDFSEWAPKFNTMNGRAWPDTIAGNWDVTVKDPANLAHVYNIATTDQNALGQGGAAPYLTKDIRLGSQPWTSLIQATAGETILLRFANLGYNSHNMELGGLPFRVIGKDAKNLLQGRDGYAEDPTHPTDPVLSNQAKRDDISYTTFRTELHVAESRDILVKIPADAGGPSGAPTIFEFFDRNYATNSNKTPGGPVAGGMRTQLHVYAPGVLPRQDYPQQVFKTGYSS